MKCTADFRIEDDFDLAKIADSGQCFRWERAAQPTCYHIIAGADCIYVTDLGEGRFRFEWSELSERDGCVPKSGWNGSISKHWFDYFDFATDYRGIRAKIDPAEDPYLWRASEAGRGIRILRQDPWEMLISFIISQNKNIPGIRRCIEALARLCGERRTDCRGEEYYAFPTPEAVAACSEEDLAGCKLGYRSKYVLAAAQAVLDRRAVPAEQFKADCGHDRSGSIDLRSLIHAPEPETIAALTGIYGVGVKVANCVSLFGLHHVDAFPVDVWIRRILEAEYPGGFPFERYHPYCGIYQQYLFAYARNQSAG